MARRTVIFDKKEIKIYILYLLKLLADMGKPVDLNTLSEVVAWEGTVNHFDFADAFAELISSGLVSEDSIGMGKEYYSISDKGSIVIDNLASSLTAEVRDNVYRSLMRLIAYKKDGSEYLCNIEKEDGGYRIYCSLKVGERKIVDINVFSENLQYLEKIQIDFENRAEHIIKSTVGLLTGDVDFLS